MQNEAQPGLLLLPECEAIVQDLRATKLEDFGSVR